MNTKQDELPPLTQAEYEAYKRRNQPVLFVLAGISVLSLFALIMSFGYDMGLDDASAFFAFLASFALWATFGTALHEQKKRVLPSDRSEN